MPLNQETSYQPDQTAAAEGLLVVVSGPSAVGKDTVLDALLSAPHLPHPVEKCVTATTRPPREGEKDGIDYHFVTVGQFSEMVAQDALLEYAEVHNHWYGTPSSWVHERRTKGIDVILKIDVQGGLTVKKAWHGAVLIFLRPPSLVELERRLRHRATETENDIARRLLNARSELGNLRHYDYAVTNDDVQETVEHIRAILMAEHCRISRSSRRTDDPDHDN